MSGVKLNEHEVAVLRALAAEPDAWLAAYYHSVITAAGGELEASKQTLGALRRRKLVDAEGRGMHAGYGINDKGKAALAELDAEASS